MQENKQRESIVPRVKGSILAVIALCVLAVILFAALRPFTPHIRNQVSWLAKSSGLQFGDYAEIASSTEFSESLSGQEGPCSLEIWLEPKVRNDPNTLLAFYTRQNPFQFRIRQSRDSLLLIRGWSAPDDDHWAEMRVIHLLHQGIKSFLTVTANGNVTSVYLDGELAGQPSAFRLTSKDLKGRLIVGNSPLDNDTWSGELRGLAIYDNELDPKEIQSHYHLWASGRHPEISATEGMIGLYTFDEGGGQIIHNHAKSGPDLYIPPFYGVGQRAVLKPFWKEYRPGWSYYKSIAINIIGFMPLGFFFRAYLERIGKINHSSLLTIALGFSISLAIEILQAYIPTRDSGMTDIITNTLGTTIGAKLSGNKLIVTLLGKLGL
jgi:VanZ like family/Concanavalin A-like lectin/glucanases superfamily